MSEMWTARAHTIAPVARTLIAFDHIGTTRLANLH
ncbi:hypothetical protein FB559_5264 [Actinoallomurus bryophytorum]|uniref:Uncharacterized protein n=1 Tax=Actinoallomurus bryophytorum TaxID=1490222 RepID=A0A543CR52_9ACTN|nr:hypothetical protein FB559_5264 [Actinoallomurus bryophytorum]